MGCGRCSVPRAAGKGGLEHFPPHSSDGNKRRPVAENGPAPIFQQLAYGLRYHLAAAATVFSAGRQLSHRRRLKTGKVLLKGPTNMKTRIAFPAWAVAAACGLGIVVGSIVSRPQAWMAVASAAAPAPAPAA